MVLFMHNSIFVSTFKGVNSNQNTLIFYFGLQMIFLLRDFSECVCLFYIWEFVTGQLGFRICPRCWDTCRALYFLSKTHLAFIFFLLHFDFEIGFSFSDESQRALKTGSAQSFQKCVFHCLHKLACPRPPNPVPFFHVTHGVSTNSGGYYLTSRFSELHVWG